MIMTERDFSRFFEEDVQEAIPAIVKEWMRECGITDSETIHDELLESRVRCFPADDVVRYTFLSEPYIDVVISHDLYEVTIADRMSTRMKFSTNDFEEFKNYWNNMVVEYYGFDAKLPLLK